MKGVEPVGAKLAIHGDDLRCRWLVVIGPDRRSWRYDCCTCLSAGCGVAGTAGSHAQSKNREILVRRPRGRRATSPGAKGVPAVAQSGKAGSTSPVDSYGKPGTSCLVGVLGGQMRSARAGHPSIQQCPEYTRTAIDRLMVESCREWSAVDRSGNPVINCREIVLGVERLVEIVWCTGEDEGVYRRNVGTQMWPFVGDQGLRRAAIGAPQPGKPHLLWQRQRAHRRVMAR